MEWLLSALAKTDCPMSCPHGRPVVLRYSVKEIEKALPPHLNGLHYGALHLTM